MPEPTVATRNVIPTRFSDFAYPLLASLFFALAAMAVPNIARIAKLIHRYKHWLVPAEALASVIALAGISIDGLAAMPFILVT